MSAAIAPDLLLYCPNPIVPRCFAKLMGVANLPPDDRPPNDIALGDRILRHQLELSLTQRFQQQCDPETLQVLAACDWSIVVRANAPVLVVECRDRGSNWHVLNRAVAIGDVLERFSTAAKIRIVPAPGQGHPFEMRVDERSVYRESSE